MTLGPEMIHSLVALFWNDKLYFIFCLFPYWTYCLGLNSSYVVLRFRFAFFNVLAPFYVIRKLAYKNNKKDLKLNVSILGSLLIRPLGGAVPPVPDYLLTCSKQCVWKVGFSDS